MLLFFSSFRYEGMRLALRWWICLREGRWCGWARWGQNKVCRGWSLDAQMGGSLPSNHCPRPYRDLSCSQSPKKVESSPGPGRDSHAPPLPAAKTTQSKTTHPFRTFLIIGDTDNPHRILRDSATMKRKLAPTDAPEGEAAQVEQPAQDKSAKPTDEPAFDQLGLDFRLVQAIAKQKFEKPTLVQRKTIPLAIQGQDVLCKAKTGSGKTAAYLLPALNGILTRKTVCRHRSGSTGHLDV